MLQATWKLRFGIQLTVFGMLGWISQTAFGQDPLLEEGDLDEHATGIINTITAAIKGDAAAQNEMIALAGKATFVLAMLFIAYMVASTIGRWVGGIVTKKVDVTLGKFLSKAIRNIIMLIVAMVALEQVGVDVTAFAAVLAAAGFAVVWHSKVRCRTLPPGSCC